MGYQYATYSGLLVHLSNTEGENALQDPPREPDELDTVQGNFMKQDLKTKAEIEEQLEENKKTCADEAAAQAWVSPVKEIEDGMECKLNGTDTFDLTDKTKEQIKEYLDYAKQSKATLAEIKEDYKKSQSFSEGAIKEATDLIQEATNVVEDMEKGIKEMDDGPIKDSIEEKLPEAKFMVAMREGMLPSVQYAHLQFQANLFLLTETEARWNHQVLKLQLAYDLASGADSATSAKALADAEAKMKEKVEEPAALIVTKDNIDTANAAAVRGLSQFKGKCAETSCCGFGKKEGEEKWVQGCEKKDATKITFKGDFVQTLDKADQKEYSFTCFVEQGKALYATMISTVAAMIIFQ